jgi:hypothetical protein
MEENVTLLDQVLPLLLEIGPELLAGLVLLLIPAEKVPVLGKFITKLGEKLKKEDE